MTFGELQDALRVLGLGERATMKEITVRHRELVKKYHPDNGMVADNERIREINAANRLIFDYLKEYRFSFSEEEFYEQNPEERVRQQFMTDPLWGKR